MTHVQRNGLGEELARVVVVRLKLSRAFVNEIIDFEETGGCQSRNQSQIFGQAPSRSGLRRLPDRSYEAPSLFNLVPRSIVIV
jgi:hypothetical protein